MLCCGKSATVAPEGVEGPPMNFKFLAEPEMKIVESSWDAVLNGYGGPKFCSMLFRLYFQLDPDAQKLFLNLEHGTDFYESQVFLHHVEIFSDHITLAVKAIRDHPKLVKMYRQLGKMHDAIFSVREMYGKEEEANHAKMRDHFHISREALQQTLQTILKENCSNEIKEAWSQFYLLLITILMSNIECCNRSKSVA